MVAPAIRNGQFAAGADHTLGHRFEQALLAAFGLIFLLASRALAQYFYGMHKPMVVLAGTLLGNLTNVVLNSLLIYGATPVSLAGPGAAR